MEEETEYQYPYYRMSVWMLPEDDITDLCSFIRLLRMRNVPHALAFGMAENTTKYALWVVGDEVVRTDIKTRVFPNSEPMGEIFYKFGNIKGEI